MLYLLAIFFSLVVSGQSFASGITAGNITHVKNGRLPKAGAAIFPTIPIFPLLAIGAAWLLQAFIPQYAVWILVGSFLIFSVFWAFSFTKLKAEFDRIKKP
jgi:thiol:disulfide interchange protein